MIAPWADVPFVRYSATSAVALSEIREAKWAPDYGALVLHMAHNDPIIVRGSWASDVWLRLTGVPAKQTVTIEREEVSP